MSARPPRPPQTKARAPAAAAQAQEARPGPRWPRVAYCVFYSCLITVVNSRNLLFAEHVVADECRTHL